MLKNEKVLHVQTRLIQANTILGILLLGSGYAFHNLGEMLGNPKQDSFRKSEEFNNWLKEAVTTNPLESLSNWTAAPSARFAHPREEHLLPLLVTAATGGSPQIIFDQDATNGEHAISGYMFQ